MRLLLLALLCAPALATSQPVVLLSQRPVIGANGEVVSIPLASVLADELARDGRVRPVEWSLNDPVFRAAVEAGGIVAGRDPTDEQLRAGAGKLRAEFWAVVEGHFEDGMLACRIRLHRGGSSVWRDERRITVIVGEAPDWESTARTLARTWVGHLASGPFRRHPPSPRVVPNRTPETTGNEAAAPKQRHFEDAERLRSQGRVAEAVAMLRDAVDAEPGSLALRSHLCGLLLRAGMPREAAEEAERALALEGANAELRLAAARAFVTLEEFERAREHIRLAGDTGAAGAVLRAEIALATGDLPAALREFDVAVVHEDGFDARLGRAIARALTGDRQGCRADVMALPGVDEERLSVAYARVLRFVSTRSDRLVRELGALLRDIRAGDEGLGARADLLAAEADALAALVEALPVPNSAREANERRLLGQKLLAQAGRNAVAYAENRDEELAAEASLSLAEAVRQFAPPDSFATTRCSSLICWRSTPARSCVHS